MMSRLARSATTTKLHVTGVPAGAVLGVQGNRSSIGSSAQRVAQQLSLQIRYENSQRNAQQMAADSTACRSGASPEAASLTTRPTRFVDILFEGELPLSGLERTRSAIVEAIMQGLGESAAGGGNRSGLESVGRRVHADPDSFPEMAERAVTGNDGGDTSRLLRVPLLQFHPASMGNPETYFSSVSPVNSATHFAGLAGARGAGFLLRQEELLNSLAPNSLESNGLARSGSVPPHQLALRQITQTQGVITLDLEAARASEIAEHVLSFLKKNARTNEPNDAQVVIRFTSAFKDPSISQKDAIIVRPHQGGGVHQATPPSNATPRLAEARHAFAKLAFNFVRGHNRTAAGASSANRTNSAAPGLVSRSVFRNPVDLTPAPEQPGTSNSSVGSSPLSLTLSLSQLLEERSPGQSPVVQSLNQPTGVQTPVQTPRALVRQEDVASSLLKRPATQNLDMVRGPLEKLPQLFFTPKAQGGKEGKQLLTRLSEPQRNETSRGVETSEFHLATTSKEAAAQLVDNQPDTRDAAVISRQSGGSVGSSSHANWVSMGGQRKAIVAMPTDLNERDQLRSQRSGFNGFLHMLAQQVKPVVLDLRSMAGTDTERPAITYFPLEGGKVSHPEGAQEAAITVSHAGQRPLQKPLPNVAGTLGEATVASMHIATPGRPVAQARVIQFTQGPDEAVSRPSLEANNGADFARDRLREMGKLANEVANKVQEQGGTLVVYGDANTGDTGTVLVYSQLLHELIDEGKGKELVNAMGQVDSRALVKYVATAVAQRQIEQGSSSLETPEQFKLITRAIKKDVEQLLTSGSSDKSDGVGMASPEHLTAEDIFGRDFSDPHQTVQLPGKKIGISDNPFNYMVPEPSVDHLPLNQHQQHWTTILEKGVDAVEVLSDPRRFVGEHHQSQKGLGTLLQAATTLGLGELNRGAITVGGYRILGIRETESSRTLTTEPSSTLPTENLILTQTFEVTYLPPGEPKQKTLNYTQILIRFDGKKLTSDQLSIMTSYLEAKEEASAVPYWITSVRGVGRPSAIAVTRAMKAAIANGRLNSELELVKQIDDWASQGKKALGHLFINTTEQREHILELGRQWLAEKQGATDA